MLRINWRTKASTNVVLVQVWIGSKPLFTNFSKDSLWFDDSPARRYGEIMTFSELIEQTRIERAKDLGLSTKQSDLWPDSQCTGV